MIGRRVTPSGKSLLRITPTRWSPVATGGFVGRNSITPPPPPMLNTARMNVLAGVTGSVAMAVAMKIGPPRNSCWMIGDSSLKVWRATVSL